MKRKITRRITMMMTALMLTTICTPQTYAATYLKGDVTCDGQVNLNDAQKALRVALGIDSSNADIDMRGDIDGDGKLNLRDVQQILRGALGITSLGTGETDDGTGTDEHEHDYKPVYRTVPEKGHWETVTVKPAEDVVIKAAWDETITESAYICNGCEKIFRLSEYSSSSNAKAAHTSHVRNDNCSGGYHTEKVTTTIHHDAEIVHHDAVTEQKWIVDQNAEQVIDHYECTECGISKNEPATEVTGSAVETCEHVWKDDVKTVTEEVTKDAWDEPVEVTEDTYVCNTCKEVFGKSEYGNYDEALDALMVHQWEDSTGCAGYHTEKVTHTIYVHHDAETTTVTKEVKNGVVCSKCGTHADKEPELEASASDFKYGDVNNDNSVNSSDALAILRHVVGIKTLDNKQLKAGDVDDDKDVTVCDALMILQYSVEIIVKFPAEAGETNTEDNPLTITDKAYICNYCGKEFQDKLIKLQKC